MKINNVRELNLFKQAMARCRRAILVRTANGDQFDMRTPAGFIKGLAALMARAGDADEPEIYTNCYEDDITMLHFFQSCAMA